LRATKFARSDRPTTEETLMHSRNLLLALAAAAMTLGITLVPVQAQTPMALSGQVSSAADGPMEGVVVSAKREGSTATISVVSDGTGKFGIEACARALFACHSCRRL
jgi:hypothetical protein